MRPLPFPLLLCVAACAVFLPAQAAVYSCVNAQGEKSISDKPCAPTQSTQKVYARPRTPPPAEQMPEQEPRLPPAGDHPLMPQSPEELRAMLRAREREAQGLPPEGSAEERAWLEALEREKQERQRREPQRQMERYLQEKEQQRQEWRSDRQDGARSYEEAAQDRQRQSDCAWLQQRKNQHTTAARQAFSYGSQASRARSIEAEREVSRQMGEQGCD